MAEDEDTGLSLENKGTPAEISESTDDRDSGVVYDIPVKVSIVLGTTYMQVKDILYLERGAVVELERKVGDAIDIFVNSRLVARGEVIVVDDRLGLTITEVIKVDN